jgi:hypothetical protein
MDTHSPGVAALRLAPAVLAQTGGSRERAGSVRGDLQTVSTDRIAFAGRVMTSKHRDPEDILVRLRRVNEILAV